MSRLRISVALLASLGMALEAFASTQPFQPSKNPFFTKFWIEDPSRFLTFVSTDKPIYRHGEKVYVRGVMLDPVSHAPFHGQQNLIANVTIKAPTGEQIAAVQTQTENSVWAFDWEVPATQSGGEYTISVHYPGGQPPAQRKFDIRAFRPTRLSSQIKFQRDGYGPGDKVTATLDVKRAEGGVPAGAKVTVNAIVDGTSIKGDSAVVDAKGSCKVSFKLPEKIARGEGSLGLTIDDSGVVETASKTIPILLQTLDLQMYPEGGDLIAGYKNRVYVQAFQPNGKPADLEATIVSEQPGHAAVAKFRSEHEGRGRFEFIPEANRHYSLHISQPSGIKTVYKLPEVKLRGAVIRTTSDVYKKDVPVSLQVACTSERFRVSLSKHEKEIGSVDAVAVKGGQNGGFVPITFTLPADTDGVLTVTVKDDRGTPLAERLIFREEAHRLNVSVKLDKAAYTPGGTAKVTVKTSDEKGKPVSAVVGLTVTDDSTQQLVDKREQAPRLPVMVFLEPEVNHLADARIYLDAKNVKAPLATDLLLGTQGWRRFALVDVEKFVKANGDKARRALAIPTTADNGSNNFGQISRRLINARIGQQELPPDIGQVEGPRDLNLFQVEPTVIDERHYTSGRDERHQKTSPTLPEGAPIPDNEDGIAQLGSVDRYTFFANPGKVIVTREFAHQVRPNRKSNDRTDFAETLLWKSGIKTDEHGEVSMTFGLSDSVTTFDVMADAFSDAGSVGSADAALKSAKPFYTEAKLPLEVTSGDKVLLPINLINGSANPLQNMDVSVKLDGPFKLSTMQKESNSIGGGARARWIQPIDVGFGSGLKPFVLDAKSGSYEDKITRQLSIKPMGFPHETTFGGVIEPNKSVKCKITIGKDLVNGSMTSNSMLLISPLSKLTSALERMILDPNGCFEQTSSTSYPLTMAQQYFLSHTDVDPKLVETSRQKLEDGYKKLVAFWCPDRGYEWFGENPGHEALTAFGLLHFTDMAKVRNVDQKMVATTRDWLMKQKDGQGGFTRKRRALHTWIEDKDCSNAYIVWALLETGQSKDDLSKELSSLKTAADASKNNYVVALAANAFALSGDKEESKKLMHRLASKQKVDGSIEDVTSSIVGTTGESLEVEGTALAVLAWLRDPQFAVNVERSMKFLSESCQAGRYGSTQATVLALRAIVEYDRQHATAKAPGKIRLYADGQPIGDWVTFNEQTKESVKLPDISELLTPGDHEIELRMEGGSTMPYTMAVNYNTAANESDKDCKLNLTVSTPSDMLTEGQVSEVDAVVTNKDNKMIPNPVAIIGMPGGFEPRHDQLKELVKKHTIDAFEVRGREVVLYWRTLQGNAKTQIPISVVAAVPGSYTGPANRAYLYYTDEHKQWTDGLHVDITPKK